MANKIKFENSKSPVRRSQKRRTLHIFIFIAIVAVCIFGFFRLNKDGIVNVDSNSGTFTVKRGDLDISVTESGDIKAIKSTVIKSEVERRTAIVTIVPEGTIITPQDVNEGKVLVELDSSELTEQLPQREIEFAAAEASHAESQEAYQIQIKQNESDIAAAELKVKFALMDLQKYLGANVAQIVIDNMNSEPNSSIDMEYLLSNIDTKDPNSGSEASQKLMDLNGSITLAQQNLEKATYTLTWTKKLFEKEYVAETELREHELQKTKNEIDKDKANIALNLFKLYEFPKQVQQLLSDYKEADLELERTRARARSQLSQAKAKLASAEASLRLRKERLEQVKKELEACIIKAPAPGQVVYSSSTERWSRYQIEPGAEIPRGYKIIELPDTSKMKVEIKINEVWIDKVQIDQKAKIIVSAFPDKVFEGKVLKKAPLADQKYNWEPDVKVYTTDVSIEGSYDFIKTGMTAKVTIIIDELKDVLQVPIQSVVTENDQTKVCYLMTNGKPTKCQVETGLFNDDFVEIKSGLNEGDNVLLNPPRWASLDKTEKQTTQDSNDTETTPDANDTKTEPTAPDANDVKKTFDVNDTKTTPDANDTKTESTAPDANDVKKTPDVNDTKIIPDTNDTTSSET